jgi:hypothetical protein
LAPFIFYPTTKNDGELSNNEYAIPEGTLIRIKPDCDIDSMTDIGPIPTELKEYVDHCCATWS